MPTVHGLNVQFTTDTFSGGFPARFGRAFRFRWPVGKILRNDNNRMAEAKIRNETKCKKIATQTLESAAHDTHEPPPPGRTRHFRTPGAASGGSRQAVGKAFHSLPAARRSLFRGSASPFGKTCIPRRRHRAKRRCDLPTPDKCRNFCQAASHTSRINGDWNPFKFT